MEIEFIGPILMTKESKFEELNEPLEDFAVTKNFDEWYQDSCKRSIAVNNSEFSSGFFTVDRYIIESVLRENEIEIPVYMLGPVANFEGEVLTAIVRAAVTIEEIILYFKGKKIALYDIIKSRPKFKTHSFTEIGERVELETPIFDEGFYKIRFAELDE
jgi:hypothetical protein